MYDETLDHVLESAASVHRVLKTMTIITPELLESTDGVVGIPCPQTLSLWRDTIPGLNDVQTRLFIESSDKFTIGKLCYSYNRKNVTFSVVTSFVQPLMRVKLAKQLS